MLLGEKPVQVNNQQLRSGWLGNIDTVQVMKRVAHKRKSHPLVRELALGILNQQNIPSHNYVDEALAIGRYVQSKVRYVRDIAGVEQLHDPVTMIEQIQRGVSQGDCDDMSLLIATLLLSIGHRPKFRIVRYRGLTGPYQHIYVVVYEKNKRQDIKRIVIDAIIKDKPIGFEVNHTSGKEITV
jgi:hypothetical protein